MIGISFIFPALLITIGWIVFRINFYIKNKPINIIREVFINLFFIYFLTLVNLTLFKCGELIIDYNIKFYVNYIPLVETIKMFTNNFADIHLALYNVIGNILLFIPLGFCIPLFFNKKNKIHKIVLYGFLASLTIELIQLFTPNNFTDIDDIIFNTFGTVIGLIIFNIFYMIFKNTKIGDFSRSINSSYDGNLVLKVAKPIGTVILLFATLSLGLLYNDTIPSNLTDDNLALEVFDNTNIKDYKIAKDFEDYKFFLFANDEFIELKTIKKTFINRWYDEKINTSFDIKDGNYYIMTLYKNNLISGVAFGKNIDANAIEVNFKNTKYIENLNEEEYFIVPFPNFERIDKLIDFYDFFDGKESLDLEIKFYHKDGTECTHMKFT